MIKLKSFFHPDMDQQINKFLTEPLDGKKIEYVDIKIHENGGVLIYREYIHP